MKNKVIYVAMIIAIILGIVMINLKGFNYGILYSEHKRLEIIIGTEYDINDIKNIVKDTIKEKSIVRKTTLFGTNVAIDAKDMKDDELNNLFSKLNEKYGKNYSVADLNKDDSEESEEETKILVKMTNINETNMYDLLKYCIFPAIISLIIVMIYYGIRFHKLYKNAWILEPIKFALKMVLVEGVILSVIAIARIPVTQYISALLIFVWLLEIIVLTLQNEKKLEDGLNEE